MKLVRTCAALTLVSALTACSMLGQDGDAGGPSEYGTDAAESGPVTLLAHDSFALPKPLLKRFEQETGRPLKVIKGGDAGALTTRLALTAGNPEGDVAFGVDNTFASRALDEDVFAPVDVGRPAGSDRYDLPEGDDRMVPIDTASVCINVDTAWYSQHDQDPPKTFADLAAPAYKDQLVVPAATTSSPGMAFLLATIDEYGDQWPAYWSDLMANGAELAKGWSNAYYEDFSYSGGDRPIVLSYDTSPAFTVTDDGRATSTAVLDGTCFRQVEYAGVLEGTDDPEGAKQLIEFLQSPEVQEALPESMYVYPVRDDVALPAEWERFAEQAPDPAVMDPAEIAKNREKWLAEWTDVTTR